MSSPAVFDGRQDSNPESCLASRHATNLVTLPQYLCSQILYKASIMYQGPMMFLTSGARLLAVLLYIGLALHPFGLFILKSSGPTVPMSSVFSSLESCTLSSFVLDFFLAPSSHAGFLESARVLYFLGVLSSSSTVFQNIFCNFFLIFFLRPVASSL